MQYGTDTGNWVCGHCHHTVGIHKQPDPVRPGRWPAIIAVSLAVLALASLGIVMASAGSGDDEHEPPTAEAALLARLLSRNTGLVTGVGYQRLGRDKMGAELQQLITESPMAVALMVVTRACGRGPEEIFDWVSVSRRQGGAARGIVVFRLQRDRAWVDDCLKRAVDEEGQVLRIEDQDKLTKYTVATMPVVVGWLDAKTVVVVQDWDEDRQREALQDLFARDGPSPSNLGVVEALHKTDTNATFWMAMVKPELMTMTDDDLDLGLGGRSLQRWYDREVAGLLGATPRAVYGSIDLGKRVTIRAGAQLVSERKAKTVAVHVRARFEQAQNGGLGTVRRPDFDRLDPVLRARLQQHFDDSVRRVRGVAGLMLSNTTVRTRGEWVEFRVDLSAEQVGAIRGNRDAAQFMELINSYLPRELKIPH